MECTAQMDVEHRSEVLPLEVVERFVAQYPGVVDHHVDAAELVDGLLHHRRCRFRIGDRSVVGDRRPARVLDLGNDLVRGPALGAGPVGRHAGIVDDDRRPALRQQTGVMSPEAPARSGDEGDPVLEIDHSFSPLSSRSNGRGGSWGLSQGVGDRQYAIRNTQPAIRRAAGTYCVSRIALQVTAARNAVARSPLRPTATSDRPSHAAIASSSVAIAAATRFAS